MNQAASKTVRRLIHGQSFVLLNVDGNLVGCSVTSLIYNFSFYLESFLPIFSRIPLNSKFFYGSV